MYNFYDVAQNTDQWMAYKCGKLGSSSGSAVMANYGKAFGDPAKKLAVEIAVQQITGKNTGQNYTNEHMERGHEQEPLARMLYEKEFFCTVRNGGFFDCGFTGCSPDGLVGDDGLIEAKSVIPSVHFANIKRMNIDPSYKWQLAKNLKETGRKWIDFISFCQDFPVGKQLFTYRIYAKDLSEEFKMLDTRIAEFQLLVEETKKTILETNYINC